MSFSIGLVGLPNAGKSTLFNALTKNQQAAVANYPFCTIDPNIGCVLVPDPNLDKLAELYHPKKVTPTAIEFIDIAGLVKDAHKGEGLGNKFLSHIHQVKAIAHVVRAFPDADVTKNYDGTTPQEDIDIIETEIFLSDLQVVAKHLHTAEKNAKSGEEEWVKRLAILKKIETALQENKAPELSPKEKKAIKDISLLSTKPKIYILNVDEKQLVDPAVKLDRQPFIKICAKTEAELSGFTDEEVKEYLADLGLQERALDQFVRAAYSLLDLITFYTAGPEEVRAWTVKAGSTAPVAAGKIHTDFAKNFIRAEVTPLEAVLKHGSEEAAQKAGQMRVEGKDYVVQDEDVIYFRVG